ncbi:hypothetical protein, partial [Heyndrickxia coagulans]|uniref:hypothetical protein n=1 Tax=Heyndrickxia coagulans TaxID=1398 RepID=UPI002E1BEBC4|nr:hypothetical protein [Heyndrickxia coagulans]
PWPAMEIKSRGDQQMVTGLYSFVSSLLLNIPINRLLGKKKKTKTCKKWKFAGLFGVHKNE